MATALETAIAAQIATIGDPIRKALAEEKLAEYIGARAALSAQAGSDLISYTRIGFSATKLKPQEFREYVTGIETELRELIYGSVSLIDNSVRPEGSGPV